MIKKNKLLIIFVLLFIYNYLLCFYSISNNDLIWNYGFCYNFAKGLSMYRDYSMVITPLYPTIFGTIMNLLGNNTIIFYLSNALVPTIILFIIYKYYKKAFIETMLLLTFVNSPNYNLLCMLFLFILFYLEDKNSNDYLIGFILGLTFLTKSSFIVLTLASVYYIKNFKKVLKRFIGFLIPNLIFILYFYLNGTLFDYINLAFGSLFDFATKNIDFSLGILIFLISVIYLIREYIRKKDIKILYILLFQIMSYPIFNLIHIIYSLVPLVFYIVLNTNNKTYLKYNKYLCIFLICPILSTLFQNVFLDLKMGTNALEYKKIEAKYYNDANTIKKNVDNLDKAYFIMYEAYYNKLLLNLPINKYDMLLQGNMGYDGENNVIKYFDSLPMGTQFIMYRGFENGQASLKIYNHIRNNYKFKKSFDKYEVYIK